MTHRRSSTTDHTLASCSVCCAFTHHDRPITINRMPVLPPFLNPCHVSPVGTWDITEKVEGRWRPVLVPRGLQVLPPHNEPISVFHWLKRRYYFLLFTFDPLRDLLGSQLGIKVLFPEISI